MSKQNVMAFDLRIRGDKELQSRVAALASNDADGLVKLGAEAGFNFSASELLEVIGVSPTSDKLSTKELDQEAGGPINVYLTPLSPIIFKFSSPPPGPTPGPTQTRHYR